MATAESLALGYGKAYGALVYALSASSLEIATPVMPHSAGHPTILPSASPRSSWRDDRLDRHRRHRLPVDAMRPAPVAGPHRALGLGGVNVVMLV